jgi:hypothetical protein
MDDVQANPPIPPLDGRTFARTLSAVANWACRPFGARLQDACRTRFAATKLLKKSPCRLGTLMFEFFAPSPRRSVALAPKSAHAEASKVGAQATDLQNLCPVKFSMLKDVSAH